MFCSSCGSKLLPGARFCSSCGAGSLTRKVSPVLSWIFAVCFLLLGALPYILQTGSTAYEIAYTTVAHDGLLLLSAFSTLSSFSQMLLSLVSFSASALAVLIGLLLLKKDVSIKTPMIVCLVFHGITVMVSACACLLLGSSQETIVSLYTGNAELVAAGADLFKLHPELLSLLQRDHIIRIIFSVLTIVGAAVSLRLISPTRLQKNSMLGILLMLIALPVIRTIGGRVTTQMVSMFGNSIQAANSWADNIFNDYLGTACLIAFVVYLAIAILLPYAKRWKTEVSMVAATAVAGSIALLFTRAMAVATSTPADIMDPGTAFLQEKIVGAVLIMIAMCLWFSAVTRNRLPRWQQIVWPCLLPVIYCVCEIIQARIFAIEATYFGAIVIAILIILVATLSRPRASR